MNREWVIPESAAELSEYEALVPWVAATLQRAGLLTSPEPRPLARLIGQLLHNRHISPPCAAGYLDGDSGEHEPLLLKGMSDAVVRVGRAIDAREPIAVYGDYDVDGISATALLVTALQWLGARAVPYIPHRVDEGYGLNADSLRTLKNQGTLLVISVDCGIRSAAEANIARSLGLDLIITDHHEVPERLPDAVVINPRQPGCPYPYKDLAGVGIAYKLAQALLDGRNESTRGRTTPEEAAERLVDLVALGTVADVARLTAENRNLVRKGLTALNHSSRLGIRSLAASAGIRLGSVDSAAIGYALAPRLNAAGRLEHALLSYDLLMSTDRSDADARAARLSELNRERQQLTRACVARARSRMLQEPKGSPIIFAADETYPQGIVGLMAGRLAEEFYRPAIVIERGPDVSKGSARSIPEFSIIDALDQCADLLLKYGGHKAAAGFSIETERLSHFHARLTQLAQRTLGAQPMVPRLHADAHVSFRLLDRPLLHLLAQLEPTGEANPPPIFVARRVTVRSSQTVGRDREHLRLRLLKDNVLRDAVAFRQAKHWAGRLPTWVDVAFAFEWNEFNGTLGLQLNIKDLKASEGEAAQDRVALSAKPARD